MKILLNGNTKKERKYSVNRFAVIPDQKAHSNANNVSGTSLAYLNEMKSN